MVKNIRKVILLLILLIGCTQFSQGQSRKEALTPGKLQQIRNMLDSILVEDQKYRSNIEENIKKYGHESEQVKKQIKIMRKTDSSNLVVVEKILDTYGWLYPEQIGKRANSTLFLVIQHSNQQTQEKYLPMMRQAVREGKALPQDLALLEDRILLGKGELQVYGSQIGTDPQTGEMYVLPVVDPDRINERRTKVGLDSIEEYISHWNIKWDIEDYKKKLPKWIKNLKEERKK
ncbi:hypothetical protein GXP67_30455 [Rhodocytophaga rosea]|uniref:Lipoprotein n=1 Tax=Rhodocytophaga rosea TaxID=2704465 RepID=A0A6C0GRV3_9BACT|nr:DUF6624 domain-containing protein [Rhodocytophaga rosea]QHT70667.1 hypothetical protein GXP67_30455 [Rhodocytophaga rosea]